MDLIEEGRSAGLQIGGTQIHIIYMPVNIEPQDRIQQCFEGLSQIIMSGVN